jgi:hypothetical protein
MWCCAHVCACSARINAHSRSPTPYLHRIVSMSVCTTLGLDLSSRLAAYAGYVVLRARLRAQRAHKCALAIADPLSSSHSSNEYLCQFLARSV